MSDIAIRVEDLGKQYHIGGPQQTSDRLGDQLVDIFKAPIRRVGKLLRGQTASASELDERFWALKDINFEIKRGEVVGIIGRNGAGKSTLLKILSRIAEPTEGYADIFGRVGSLLEVGTGFHPELTGRENVFLNGAILGMKRDEIKRKFDEIVAFAEINKFIDTPVKHYSSGMYVRLAFAVAAHLEPEILLVDEVLAVGDMAFQKKCLGKMDDVAQQGRTVLFVSHNMGLMQTLCERGIFLQQGVIDTDSTMTGAVDAYLKVLEQTREQQNLAERTDRKGRGKVKLVDVEITSPRADKTSYPLRTGHPARFELHVNAVAPNMGCNVFLYDHVGQPITEFLSVVRGTEDAYDPQSGLKFTCEIDQLMLSPGRYRMDVAIVGDDSLQDLIEAAAIFDVGEGNLNGRPVHTSKFSSCMPYRWIKPTEN